MCVTCFNPKEFLAVVHSLYPIAKVHKPHGFEYAQKVTLSKGKKFYFQLRSSR